jgi:hypothetical protein
MYYGKRFLVHNVFLFTSSNPERTRMTDEYLAGITKAGLTRKRRCCSAYAYRLCVRSSWSGVERC